jgi:hypothetical protein
LREFVISFEKESAACLLHGRIKVAAELQLVMEPRVSDQLAGYEQ